MGLSRKLLCLGTGILSLAIASTPCLRAQTLKTTIPLNASGGVAVNGATGTVYAADGQDVAVIDEKTNTVIATIPVPTQNYVFPVAVNPATNMLYVGDLYSTYVINATTRRFVTQVNAPASSIAINVAKNRIYVSDFATNVYVLDGATNNLLADVSVPGASGNLAVNPLTGRVYGSLYDNYFGAFNVIDGNTDTFVASVPDGGNIPYQPAVDPLRNLVYQVDQLGTLSVVSGATNALIAAVPLGGNPCCLAVDPVSQRIYVTNNGLGTLQTVDGKTNKLIKQTAIGQGAQFVDVDPARGLIYAQVAAGIAVYSTK